MADPVASPRKLNAGTRRQHRQQSALAIPDEFLINQLDRGLPTYHFLTCLIYGIEYIISRPCLLKHNLLTKMKMFYRLHPFELTLNVVRKLGTLG